MSKGWSEADKKIVKVALERARKRAEEQTIREFRALKIESIHDLWEVELKVRTWRRNVQGAFYFSYDHVEGQLHEFLEKGWLELEDLQSLSPARLTRIKDGGGNESNAN